MSAAKVMTEAPAAGTIGDWLRDNAATFPDKIALQFEDDRSWTYPALDRWADVIAARLQTEHHVEQGDRVAFLGFNHPAMIALLFACARLGAVLVPLNWRLAPAELAFIAADCGPKVLFADISFEETARSVAQSVDGLETLPVADLESAQSLERADEATGSIADPLLIIYTSGTTGRPKGAVLTQQALLTNAIGSVDLHKMAADDRVLVVLPLFHVGGLNISLTPALYAGATVELHSRFDPGQTVEAIERFRPQVLVLVPATMMAVMNLPGWADADTSSLRMLTTGSMVVPVELIAAFEDRGISVVQVYGSTETCPIAAYTRPGEGRSNPETAGKAGCCSQVRIVDANGRAIDTPDVDGEIEVKGDHVMQGYWNSRQATADAFNQGWYRTGDIGSIDAEGNLYFRERAKHTIVSGGENIYPAEVERVLTAIPGIAEAAVCGIADDQWGEVPAAAIVLAPGSGVTQDCIQQALARELARFKHPKKIARLDQLPRNAMGKVVHDQLRMILVGE